MKNFFSFIVKRSVAIILLIVFILGFGIYCTGNMSINLLPDINVPMVCIQVIYPGASASSVEEDVTTSLEDGLKAISGVTDIDSYSYDNLSAVVLSFDYGTDTKEKKTDINNKLTGITLPDGCTTTVYDIDLNSQPVAVLSVTSDKPLNYAYSKASELQTALAAIEGVESVEVLGGGDKVVNITPYGGAELISLLLVQSLSYGSLDIPLGNLSVDGNEVQVRNNSDISSMDDIKNSPVSLPSSYVTLLASVKQIMNYYQDATKQDLIDLNDDLNSGVKQVLTDLGDMPYDEVNKLATLKTYMNIASTYSADTLKRFKTSRYYSEIEKQVEGKNDDELQDLADDIQEEYPNMPYAVSVDLLKIVRDKKLGDIITYREWLEGTDDYRQKDADDEYYELSDDDYLVLARRQTLPINTYDDEGNLKETTNELVGMDLYSYDDFTDEQVKQNINFVKQTSATGLAAIGDKKKNEGDDYVPTDEECAVLFTATDLSSEHPIVMSSMFMAFVRSDNYDYNMKVLIDEKGKLGDETEISAEQYYDIYSQLEIDDVFEIVLSPELFGFIKDTDLANLTTNSDGDQVLVVALDEIANIKEDEEYSSYAYYYDGQMNVVNGLVINIYKSNGANSSAVVKQVKSIYAEMTEDEDFDVTVSLLDDQSEFISDSISNVLVSMLIGGVLAIIIIFIFLKQVKQSLIIAVTMPLSVLAALICMYAMGITLNMVSLGGLAVGIGMLVDNSIVVIESISKHRDMGKTAYQAAVDGSCEVGGALIGSTLTTVCVFIPIIFSGGLTGEIFTDLSWAVIFSLTFSLIIAVTVIPTLYSMFNGGDKQMLKAHTPISQLEGAEAETERGETVGTTTFAESEGEDVVPAESDEKVVVPAENVVAEADVNADEIKAEEGEVHTDETKAEAEVKAEESKKSKKKKGRGGIFAKLKQPLIMTQINKIYSKILPKALSKKIVVVVAAVVIFGTSVFMVTLTGTEFLPSIDKGQIEVDMSYGANAQIEDVQKDVLAFTNTIKDSIDNIDYMSASVGKNGLLALTNTGIITVQLTTSRHTDKVVQQIRDLVATSGTIGTVTVSEVDGVVASLMSGSSGVSVSIMGEDSQKLVAITSEIRSKLTEDESLGFTDVKDTLTEQSTQYRLDFDEYKLAEYGLDYTTVITTLRVGIASYTAATVEIDGDTYSLNVQFADDVFAADKNQTEDSEEGESVKDKLANFIIGYDGTDAIHLKDVLNRESEEDDGIIEEKTDACIRRSNGYNTVVITAQNTVLDSGEAGRQMKAIAKQVLEKEEYQNYTFESSGVSSYLTDAFTGLAVALVVSFFLLYAVMAIQFSSFVKPLIVMASIPFSFTGGFIALLITGTSLNVVSFIGLIMLMGVIVNNAIVMLEKIKQLYDDGMPHYQAVQEACYARLRPILMTTLTTILALVPMAIGIGKGSELMQPLGIVVMGGLLVGTLVTLVLVPSVYCIFYRLSPKAPNGKKK